MKKNILILYSFLHFISCYSQAQTDYTISYYPHINKAELNIINEDYTSARKIYETAFENVTYQFTLDIYNYCCVLAHLREETSLKKHLSILIQRGYQPEELQEIVYLLNDEILQSSTNNYLSEHKDSLIAYYKPSEFISSQIEEIAQKEQKMNEGIGVPSTIERNTGFYKFIYIVNAIGFPDEKVIGKQASSLFTPVEEFCRFYICNNAGLESADSLINIMFSAVKEGKLSPSFFSSMVDATSNDFSTYGSNLLYKNKQGVFYNRV